MTSPSQLPDIPRERRLRAWMLEYDISNVALAEQLGISHQRVALMLKREHMPTKLHAKCLELGFPEELLPAPVDWPRGRKPRQPIFPGLINNEGATVTEA